MSALVEGYLCKLDLNTKCLTKGDYCPKASCEKISSMLDITLELFKHSYRLNVFQHYGLAGSILLGKQIAAKIASILKKRDLWVQRGYSLPESMLSSVHFILKSHFM